MDKTDLTHLLEVSSSFTEDSIDLNDYLRDPTEILLTNGDFWYIGFAKPFYSLFFESSVSNINESSDISYQYFNGTSWIDLPNLFDDTKNLKRSGFVRWEFDDMSTVTSQWAKATVNSIELFFIRLSTTSGIHGSLISNSGVGNTQTIINIADEDISKYTEKQNLYVQAENSYHQVDAVDSTMGAANITISPALLANMPDNSPIFSVVSAQGMNIVYSDDTDLKSEVRVLDDYLATGDSSFISYHVAARNEIVQSLRNGGYIKEQDPTAAFAPFLEFNNIKRENLNKWDVFDLGEIRQASKYLTLAKIFFDVSENVDDKHYQRYRDYEGMYGAAFKLFYISLDLDNDGNEDQDEMLMLNDVTVTKV